MASSGPYLSQDLSLRQEQTLAPHQIQSLEILTVPLLDLQARINTELAQNPVLERGEDAPVAPVVEDPIDELATPAAAPEAAAVADAENDGFLTNLMQLEDSWRDYLPPSHARVGAGADDEERRQYFFDTLTTEKTLEDELLEQLRLSEEPAAVRRLAELLIGHIDGHGYLRTNLSELAPLSGASVVALQQALKLVQSFEPAGVGARNLQECLLLQLERRGRKGSTAWQLVDKYLQPMSRNHIPEVARALNLSPTAVMEAWQEVRQLQPHPGNAAEAASVQFVVPEATVEKVDGQWRVFFDKDQTPHLHISAQYRKLLEDPQTSAQDRAYIREKIAGGNQLIRSLAQRASTIQRIAEVIVRRQEDFFEQGEEGMRPLTMGEVAAEIGVHETTVSRAVAAKYLQTPRGLLPLKHFFSSGYQAADGEQLSSMSVKSKIQALISEEDTAHPLSDEDLVKALKDAGIEVARRTVAKYREELGIPSSHRRRSFTA